MHNTTAEDTISAFTPRRAKAIDWAPVKAVVRGIRRIVVNEEGAWRRTEDGIEIFPVEQFLRLLWSDELIGA